MLQTNVNYGTKKAVRRRPRFVSAADVQDARLRWVFPKYPGLFMATPGMILVCVGSAGSLEEQWVLLLYPTTGTRTSSLKQDTRYDVCVKIRARAGNIRSSLTAPRCSSRESPSCPHRMNIRRSKHFSVKPWEVLTFPRSRGFRTRPSGRSSSCERATTSMASNLGIVPVVYVLHLRLPA